MSDSLQTLEGKIEPIELEDEMRSSFIDYAMSVLTDRALPDVRDGLKPSQRRILVAMNDLGLAPNKQHRKCAKIAGDTSGNYHPHGEAVIYRLPDAKGELGFISSVTLPFCASCSRARLTADGKLRLCLLREKEVDLLTPLRAGASLEDLRQLILNGIWFKPWGHGLAEGDIALNRVMSEIGG